MFIIYYFRGRKGSASCSVDKTFSSVNLHYNYCYLKQVASGDYWNELKVLMTSWVGTYQSWSEYHGNLLIIILVTMQQYVKALDIQNVAAYCFTVH